MSLGLLAIMLNECDYAPRWAESVKRFWHMFDRVLVVDGNSVDGTPDLLRAHDVPVIIRPFGDHFADQRNRGCEELGTDWILELDADELASAPLLGGLRAIIEDAERAKMDCVGLPRLNFLDGTLVAGPGHKGLDYQYRLHRNTCRWRGAVHEEITGYRARHELKIEDGHFIVHDKTSKRHAARNDYYKTLKP